MTFSATPSFPVSSVFVLVRLPLTKTVLLRVLEYYDGILFLTTNRLRSFDIAVQSRIRR